MTPKIFFLAMTHNGSLFLIELGVEYATHAVVVIVSILFIYFMHLGYSILLKPILNKGNFCLIGQFQV